MKNQMVRAAIWDDTIFLHFSVCWADLQILCSGSFSHNIKFYSFMFKHKISTQVVTCDQAIFLFFWWGAGKKFTRVVSVNSKHPKTVVNPLNPNIKIQILICYP